MSRIDYLILETLKDGEKNGKEIINELNTEFGYFWQAKTGTVYPSLKRLKVKGLIKENEEKSDASTTYYELTDRGARKLKGFHKPHHGPFPFATKFRFKPPSMPFMKFNFWNKFIEPETMIEQLEKYRLHLINELKRIDEKINELKEDDQYKEVFHDIDIE
ncbi:MAG: PadR family transcriptional regulator [Candidatus Lokiarchaeota archaeon]|nr:PadR family transcriptional regulator [Candidatus Lokiarchaeota archaeon]